MKDVKKTGLYALSLVLLLSTVATIGQLNLDTTITETRLNTFSSYEDLKNFVNASRQIQYPYNNWWFAPQPGSPTLLTNSPKLSLSAESRSDVPEYSTTNVQVEGVDEADIVKTDGEFIYVVTGRNITILKAYPPSEAQILSRIKLNGTIQGVFIKDDRLAVFEELGPYDMRISFDQPSIVPYTWRTFIKVYNVADRSKPTLTRNNISLDGSYFNSRMIGDYVYAVINKAVYQPVYQPNYTEYVSLPKIYFGNQAEVVPATQIYYSNVSDRFDTYTNVIAVNLLNDLEKPSQKTFLIGAASTMHVSQNNIYITYSTWGSIDQETTIHRIRVQNGEIDYQASGPVPGYILNQFSMDEHNGHFRIATTTGQVWGWGQSTSQNHVYILDSDLKIIGKLEDLAPGEKIYSVRFMGDRGYLVTFKKIDPLFVLDLSIPSSPKVLGQLKITGYSDYLHPLDETHIIGIGKETIEGEGGSFAWYQGVKISLFDVSDVSRPKEMAKYEIGDRGTDSPILRDHKAFLFDKSKNLLVIPVTVAEIDPSKYPGEIPPYAYGEFVWNGAYVFHLSLEEGLVLKGRITHQDNTTELMKSWYYSISPYSMKRSLYIDNVLYTISDSKIKMNSLSDLSEINAINLNS